MSKRYSPETRQDQILAAALVLAGKVGYRNITRQAVADGAGCSPGLVTHHFSTMPQLKRAVMRAAVRLGNANVVAQGLVVKDKHATKAPDTLKARALALIAA